MYTLADHVDGGILYNLSSICSMATEQAAIVCPSIVRVGSFAPVFALSS